MTNFIAKAALAAVVGLVGLGATAPANAAQIDVIVGPQRVIREPVVVVRPRVVRPRVVYVQPQPVVVVRPAYGRCSPNMALNKALNNGLNRVSINSISPNRVVVSGRIRGMFAKMSFANVRGCPRL